jgi:hypothetical protein
MLWSHASGGSSALEELYLYHNPYIGDVGAQALLIATGSTAEASHWGYPLLCVLENHTGMYYT